MTTREISWRKHKHLTIQTQKMNQLTAYIPPANALHGWLKSNQKLLIILVGAGGGSALLAKLLRGWRNRQKRQAKLKYCKKAIALLAERIQRDGVTDERMNQICQLSLSQLTEKLQKGDLTAMDVLRAYQKKALQVNEKTNAIIDIIREAEETASECDQIENRNDRPLHGIPVSIKDNFPMKGYDSVIGLSCNIDKPYSKDCVLVKVLKHQGAVPFVRTNVPQTMLSFETTNPIFGQTYNPHGEGRNPGGSSGGEAALIGGGGSPLGLGGDIGGSIRIPASMCGICGFKPTAGRLSTRDVNPIFRGQNVITSAYGPMAPDVDSLVLLMRSVLCQYHFDLDNTVPPMPFNDKVFSQKTKLRIGFYLEDDFMVPVPSMRRAVRLSVDALRNLGHEVIPWKFPDLGHRGAYLWGRVLFADGGKELKKLLKDDALDHAMGRISMAMTMNRALIKTIIYIMKWLQPKVGEILQSVLGLRSVSAWQNLVREILTFRQEVEEDLKRREINILIAPAFTLPATRVKESQNCSGAASYTTLVNVLNFPAGTLPVTTVSEEDTAQMTDYPTSDLWYKSIKKSMEGAEGLPVGVQVIGLPWQEETTLRIMKELETALQK